MGPVVVTALDFGTQAGRCNSGRLHINNRDSHRQVAAQSATLRGLAPVRAQQFKYRHEVALVSREKNAKTCLFLHWLLVGQTFPLNRPDDRLAALPIVHLASAPAE